MRTKRLVPEFVDFVPTDPIPGVLYVSTEYGTAAHACCCGCGRKVVTPLGPTEWSLITRGAAVSLYPSVGNWSFPCQSHYIIRDGAVVWAGQLTPAQIAAGRRADQQRKDAYYRQRAEPTLAQQSPIRTASVWKRVVRKLLDFWR